jgi:glutaredoxin
MKLALGVGLLAVLVLAAAFASRHISANDPRLRTGSAGVAMVTAEWCGYCRSQEAQLRAGNIPYEAIDHDSTEGQLVMAALGARGVPVTIVGQQVLRGYDPNRLREALAPLGHQLP